MKNIYKYKDATWIDLVKPTAEEVDEVARDYNLSGTVAAGLLSPTSRHIVEFGPRHAYLVLHFPAFKDDNGGDAAFELDFVIGDNYLITARYAKIEAFDKHITSLDENGLSKQPEHARNVLFFGLLRELVANFEHKLSKIDHWTRDIEKNMFDGKESRTIFELSEASRHLIDFRKITAVYPDALEALEMEGQKEFGKEFSDFSEEISTSFHKARLKMDMLADAVRELRETNDSILSVKQNNSTQLVAVITLLTDVVVGAVLIYLAVHH
ncbi:MAG: Mg2 transporter protein CorA family protein magnesium transporter [Parcubacteria group bacterium]|nr:Mg2 transporter protein CorA family protein magnesium transporter [Parcubacteria group bacterium]